MKYSKKETEHALESLKNLVPHGATIYTKLCHVSKSGMSRSIDVYIMKDNEPLYLTQWVARVTQASVDQKNGGVKVTGCGMDMGFDLVYRLSWKLLKGRDGIKDAGYPLNQRWL